MKLLFIGDSITEGQGNKSYVDYIAYLLPDHQVKKLGISGTTIGEYSLYPVEGDSLLAKLKTKKYKKAIAEADVVYLEYGCNDMSAALLRNVLYTQIVIAFVKAVDAIKQINDRVKIRFLAMSDSYAILEPFAERMISYLRDYYSATTLMKSFLPKLAISDWALAYVAFVKQVEGVIPVVTLVRTKGFYELYTGEDNLHPSDRGYVVMARNVLSSIEDDEELKLLR